MGKQSGRKGKGASPRAENGHIDIANELAEVLMRTNFSAYQSRILWVIWRKTLGWHKDEDWIANSQIVGMTGISKGHVSRTKKELILRNVVTQRGNKLAFNKDYTQWRELPIGVTPYRTLPNRVTPLPNGVTPVTQRGGHKRNYTKETIQKKKPYVEDSVEFRLASLLYERILTNDPKAKKPKFQEWAHIIDLLIRKDERDPQKIQAVIEWCQQDEFWRSNILSARKLREKFPELSLKMKRKRKRRGGLIGVPKD